MKKPKRNKKVTRTVTLPQIYARAQNLYQASGAVKAEAYLRKTHRQFEKDAISLPDLLLGFIRLVSKQDPTTALEMLNPWLEQNPDRTDGRVLACVMQDRIGDRKGARESAVAVIEAAHAAPDQVLSACNMLMRLEDDTRALTAALGAYEKLDRPLRWTNALLYIALRAADWKTVAALTRQLKEAHGAGRIAETRETPRTHLLWCDDERTNIEMIEAWSTRNIPDLPAAPAPTPEPLEGRRLRIGYLSSDFREHPTARLINGLLRHHDREQFELFMYCSGWDDGSPMRREVESHFDQVHSVTQLSDADAAALIRSCRIDVLVELNGPTRAHRMGILAHRPAPVQIDYLGWPGSVGGRVVDYVIGDPYTVPPGAEKLYPEKVIRIQQTYQVNDYASLNLPPKPERGALGLPAEGFILGMFNAINKVRAEVWAVWMEILKAVPGSVLWILDPGIAARKHLGWWTHQFGVDPKRILGAPRYPQEAHLARLQCCDLMLDPWPYGGHTSTSDALFAGVPVITLEGKNFAGRVSGSLLKAAGLEALVQPDIKTYATVAINLFRNPDELERLKRFVRQKVPSSDVFNAAAKARQFEAAYRVAVERAVEGLAPVHMMMDNENKPQIMAESPVGPSIQKDEVSPDADVLDEVRPKLVLVCGPWSSGTSAVAGMLARAGLTAPGPYVQVNDPRTPDTYEMLAFQLLLKSLASEQTLKRLQRSELILKELRKFRDTALAEALQSQEGGTIMLKHALAILLLPEMSKLFDLRLICVIRPVADIEATRVRRNWPKSFGRQGAAVLYGRLFEYLINTETTFKLVRFSDLLRDPQPVLDELAGFCGIEMSDSARKEALAFVRRP